MTTALRGWLRVVGLGLFFGPILAVTINHTNPFGALTVVLAGCGALLWTVATFRVRHGQEAGS